MLFRSKKARDGSTATAVPEPDVGALFEEIAAVGEEYRERRDPELARRILRLRHMAGIEIVDHPAATPAFAQPEYDQLPEPRQGLYEVGPAALTPELLRAAMLRGGCLLIRGLVGEEDVARLVEGIDRALAARDEPEAGAPPEYYEEFVPEPRFDFTDERSFLTHGGGGVWAADSPPVLFDVLDVFDRVGLSRLATDYLGERQTLSINKSVLRKVAPTLFERPTELYGSKPSAWHQDGSFLKDVRALNVWLSLSRCGDEAPGLDIVPRRLDHLSPTGTEGAVFYWAVAQDVAEREAGELGIQRPVFEPGDVLLFDELFLHSTAAEPEMPKTRYAVESWFFGESGFPERYAPLAV